MIIAISHFQYINSLLALASTLAVKIIAFILSFVLSQNGFNGIEEPRFTFNVDSEVASLSTTQVSDLGSSIESAS